MTAWDTRPTSAMLSVLSHSPALIQATTTAANAVTWVANHFRLGICGLFMTALPPLSKVYAVKRQAGDR